MDNIIENVAVAIADLAIFISITLMVF